MVIGNGSGWHSLKYYRLENVCNILLHVKVLTINKKILLEFGVVTGFAATFSISLPLDAVRDIYSSLTICGAISGI